ncbi:MAG: two component transcriptional regulator, AraC family [Herbinix sp.]|jgi:two-component system response regulator YesN|nr:two component transcriptional regulator, AraC family [Herbinix sp.]
MKYKVMVADDEYMIRKGIIKLLGKYSDLEVVAEAEDGEQALELVERMAIDIVFVDINMPFINGLQFIERLKEIRPGTIVNIITGYDKFEYVRQALRLEVFEYILKPLNEKNFDDTIARIVTTLNQRYRKEKYLEWVKSTIGRNRQGLLKNFFDQCLKQEYSQDKLREEMEYLGLNQFKQYSMSLLFLEQLESDDIRKHWDDALIYYAADNIAREWYERLLPVVTFFSHGYLTLICRADEKGETERMHQEYITVVERYIPVKVTAIQQCSMVAEQMPHIYYTLLEQMDEMRSYPSIIKRVKQFVLLNYHREDISLLEAAEHVNLSPQHLSRIFKNKMGITFVDYLTKVRINKAVELLRDDELKMYEIAEKIGYSTQHYFSSVFKKELGLSPIDYKANQKMPQFNQ